MKSRAKRSFLFPVILLASLTFLGSAGDLTAQWNPNQSLGGEGGSFQSGPVDNVSLFNGALSVTFPLGLPGLNLSYNSNIWLYQEIWEDWEIYVEANPNPIFNAGLGWTVSLGQLYAPEDTPINASDRWMYVAGDGSAHHFYQNLHRGEEDGDVNVRYTRDGSYLRMTKISNNKRLIEFPNGTIHTFRTAGCSDCWVLKKIEDRLGNYLEIAYNTDKTLWTLSDQYGRTHYVHLEKKCCWIGPHDGNQVTQIDLESVGGSRAVYTLEYQEVKSSRSCKDDYPGNSQRIRMPFLTRVTAPDGSTIEMLEPDGSPRYHDSVCGPPDKPGLLHGLTLPTQGQVEWEFQEYEFPSTGSAYADTSAGVETRTTYLADGTVDGVWTYKTSLYPGSAPRDEVRTQVVYPTGDCTKHYFAVPKDLDPGTWRGWEYGLPFSWRTEDEGHYLSTEIWSSSSGLSCSGAKLRSTYVSFEHDKLSSATGAENRHKWYNTNRRLASTRTRFHDDNDHFVQATFEEFDGLGHYRKATTSGDFRDGSESEDTRTIYTHFNRSPWIFAVNQETNNYCCGHDYQVIDPSEPWVLGIFDFLEIEDLNAVGETQARQEFDFDSATGFLRGARQLSHGFARSANDLLIENIEGAYGQVDSTRWYGGDVQAVSTSSGWNFPSLWVYRVDHTYAFGGLTSSQHYEQNGSPVSFLSYDVDLDPNTGAVLTSRDPSGFATSYTYDSAGRVSEIIPQAGSRTVLTYTNATAANPASVLTDRRDNAGTSSRVQYETVFDDFGRPWLEREQQAGGVWAERETLYNPRGWPVSVSALGDLAAKTFYLDYDPFGRANTIRPPDGASHDISMSYSGIREVSQSSSVATAPGVEALAERLQRFDAQGRLWQVVESSAPGNQEVLTTVDYNVGSQLSSIHMATQAGPHLEQERSFTYDNRGFLLSETHPEKGNQGNGTVLYSGYDPWGNVGTILDGPSQLSFSYDALGRKVQVDDLAASRPLVEMTYDGATGRGEGKLWQATRHNYVDLPRTPAGEEDIQVVETYTYSGLAGRVSERTTEVLPQGYSFSQSFVYHLLGPTARITYPDCLHADCPQDEPNRTLEYAFSKGWLKRVEGFTDNFAYHPNRLWSEIPHLNGVSDVQEVDPSGMARSYSLAAEDSGGSLWDWGPFTYDGSGNIREIGSETYLYDEVGRLVSGTASGYTEDYTYDPFGNLTAVAATAPGGVAQNRVISVSPATNRLTTASYDAAGNLTYWNGTTYSYDSLNRLTRQEAGSLSWTHLYTVGGERLWTIHEPGGLNPLQETVSLRDLSGRVLRQYEVSSGLGNDEWSWKRDIIYGDGRLISSVHPGGEVRHYHLDHLGTPRRVTDSAGNLLYQHDYLPYGEEITDSSQSSFPFKFTGHERDSGYAGTMDDLDYMHARYYSPFLGRFGRVDPFRGSPTSPQSLNRYAYVLGNPINLMDPFGFGPNREEGDVETIRDAITVVASYYWYLTGLGGHHSPGRRMAEPHGPIFLGRIGTMARLLRSGPPAPEPDNPVTDE
ncbi:MAG: RHS repeat-associated core domain-containing protein, partial [Thermoanaerobaculia bacterium]